MDVNTSYVSLSNTAKHIIIGVFTSRRIADFQKLRYEEIYYKGRPKHFNSTFAFSSLGNVEIEVIQLLWGKSIYQDFLVAGRRGLHHLGFDVYGDFDQRVAACAEIGIGVLMSGRGPHKPTKQGYL